MNKLLILTVLTLQTVFHVLTVRYTRSQPGPRYLSSSVVTSAEVLKLVSCLVVIFYQNHFNVSAFTTELTQNCLKDWGYFVKLLVPGLLYTLQNNLLYIGLSNLPAATYQVLYQLKLLTSALFSVFMLGKRLSPIQWMSLFVLFAGVVIVESDTAEEKTTSEPSVPKQNPFIGILTVLVSSLSSGFAGVYFERIIKGSGKNGGKSASDPSAMEVPQSSKPPQVTKSIWCANVQLALIGITLGLITGLYNDSDVIYQNGFFYGFNFWVWTIVCLQGFGGLIVSMVVKYADNILKGFACAAAILLACIGSYFLFDFQISPQFVMGTLCVVSAIAMYNLSPSNFGAAQKEKSS